MASKRALYCSCLIHILLVVGVIVEGSPVETTPKAADTSVLKTKDSPILKGTEAAKEEDTTTPRGAAHKIETLSPSHTFKTEASTTLKPGTQTTAKDRKGHKELNDITTKRNPTNTEKIPFKPSPPIIGDSTLNSSVKQTTQTTEKIPFKPSPPIFGDLTLNSSVKQTTQTPTTVHTTAPKDNHVKTPLSKPTKDNHAQIPQTQPTKGNHPKITQSPPKSQKNPSAIRITRIYRVKSHKDHDVRVHIGEGKYLNIRITED